MKEKMKNKNQFILVLVLVGILLALGITLIVLGAVGLKGESGGESAAETYYLGVKTGEEVSLTHMVTGKQKATDFTAEVAQTGYVVSPNLVLTVPSDAQQEGVISIKKKGVLVATYHIFVVEHRVTISSADEWFAMGENKSATFVQTKDIVLPSGSEQKQVALFEGRYFANGYQIINQATRTNGLFLKLNHASIYGLTLVGAKVEGCVLSTQNASVGSIADQATNTSLFGVAATGELTAAANQANENFVGGLVGQMKGQKRLSGDEDAASARLTNCKSEVRLTVEAKAKVFVGGLVGAATDMLFLDSAFEADIISVTAKDGYFAAVGGIAGESKKQYDQEGYLVSALDASKNLTVSTKITVSAPDKGLFARVFVGGLFGVFENMNLQNAKFLGELAITLGEMDAAVGGIAGTAKKTMASADVEMKFEQVVLDGTVNVTTASGANVGGLIGESEKVKLQNQAVSQEPTVQASNTNKTINKGKFVGKVIA